MLFRSEAAVVAGATAAKELKKAKKDADAEKGDAQKPESEAPKAETPKATKKPTAKKETKEPAQ